MNICITFSLMYALHVKLMQIYSFTLDLIIINLIFITSAAPQNLLKKPTFS